MRGMMRRVSGTDLREELLGQPCLVGPPRVQHVVLEALDVDLEQREASSSPWSGWGVRSEKDSRMRIRAWEGGYSCSFGVERRP